GASLVEVHARCFYRRQLQGEHVIMSYDDHLADPNGDVRQMDDYLKKMENTTELRMQHKVHWIRGAFRGQRFALYDFALGSSQSPPGYLDRHELAHAFLNQHAVGAAPPCLLVEGWAEVQSEDSSTLAGRALAFRQQIAQWAPSWNLTSPDEKQRFLTNHVDPE